MRRALLALPLLLAACGPGPVLLAVPSIAPEDRQPIGFGSVEVVQIEMPAYAEDEEIFVQTGLALSPTGGAVWADDPSRALTLDVAQALADLSGARVAPEPWPFEEPADARLDIRVAAFAADPLRAAFVIRGQWFVGSPEEGGPNRSGDFDVAGALPRDAEGRVRADPAAIASARAEAAVALARAVAQEGLR